MNADFKKHAISKIQLIFREIFIDDSLVLTEKTSPLEIEEWDSLAHINILSAVESEFDVHFSAEDMSEINDVLSMLDRISKRSN